jgi:hypothetical protein
MREQLQARLSDLRQEFEGGKGRLRELERQQAHLADQLLRVSGAIQVLEELLARSGGGDGNGQGAAVPATAEAA